MFPGRGPNCSMDAWETRACEEELEPEGMVGNEHTAQLGGGQGLGFWNEQVGRLDLNLEASDALLGRVDFSPEQEGATEVPRFGEGHNPFLVICSGCSMEGSWKELAKAREVGGSGRIARGMGD